MVEPRYCPKCAAQVHPDWSFCTHCGSRLEYENSLGDKSAACWNCGAAVSPSGATCWKCGSQLGTGEEPMLPTSERIPRGVTAQGSPGSSPSAPEESEIPVCENCGATVDTSGSFCWKCGVPLETGRDPFIPAPPDLGERPEPREETLGVYNRSSPARSREPAGRFGRRLPRTRESNLRGGLLVAGFAILLVTLFVGWYSISASASDPYNGQTVTVNGTVTQFPFNHFSETLSCEGSNVCFASQTYTGTNSGSLAGLYDLAAGLVIGGMIVGLAGIGVAFSTLRNRSRLAGSLALLAILLALLAPTVMFATQPYVLNSQGAPIGSSGNSTNGPSPRTSFFGSCSGSGCGAAITAGETVSASWGPALGWYLSLAAALPLVLGFLTDRSPKRFSFERELYRPR